MRVPQLIKWLTNRCPKILDDNLNVSSIYETTEQEKDNNFSETHSQQQSQKNTPTTDRVHNLYIDLNSLLQLFTDFEEGHVSKLQPEVLLQTVFSHLDAILKQVSPQKTLFLSLEGVSPKAKYQQQRLSKFRLASTIKLMREKKEQFAAEDRPGLKYDSEYDQLLDFDPNVITPGTEFISNFSKAIQNYIQTQQSNDPQWQDLSVIYSDFRVPGEAQYKILEFIRGQRLQANYDPHTVHCIYAGSHNSLQQSIVSSLSTHEPLFYIMTQKLMSEKDFECFLCKQQGHSYMACGQQQEGEGQKKIEIEQNDQFQFIKLFVLREYLDTEFKFLNLINFQYELERIVDDFIILLFMIGVDLLPQLPSLEISNGGLDSLLYVYKRILPYLKGYISENGEVNLRRVNILMQQLGVIEETLLFTEAREKEMKSKKAELQEKKINGMLDESEEDQYNENSSLIEYIKEVIRLKKEALKEIELIRQQQVEQRAHLIEEFNQKLLQQQEKQESQEETGEQQKEANKDNQSQQPEQATENPQEAVKTEIEQENNQAVEEQQQIKQDGQKDSNQLQQEAHLHDQEKIDTQHTQLQKDLMQLQEQLDKYLSPQKMTKIDNFNLEAAFDVYEEILIDKQKYYERFVEGISLNQSDLFNQLEIQEEEQLQAKKEPPVEVSTSESKYLQELKKYAERENSEQKIEFQDYRVYKVKYYSIKYGLQIQDFREFRQKIQQFYIEGLSWNFQYYTKGCQSWKWYYPFNFAPFASDLDGIDNFSVTFETGEPLKPIEQLLAVVSPLSIQVVPECFRYLMIDENSELADFYPINSFGEQKQEELEESESKKIQVHETTLPYIDENRLLQAMSKLENMLSDEEMDYNKKGANILFVHKNSIINQFYQQKVNQAGEDQASKKAVQLETSQENNLSLFGTIIQNVKAAKTSADTYQFYFHSPAFQKLNLNLLQNSQQPTGFISEELIDAADIHFNQKQRIIRFVERALTQQPDMTELLNKQVMAPGYAMSQQGRNKLPPGKMMMNRAQMMRGGPQQRQGYQQYGYQQNYQRVNYPRQQPPQGRQPYYQQNQYYNQYQGQQQQQQQQQYRQQGQFQQQRFNQNAGRGGKGQQQWGQQQNYGVKRNNPYGNQMMIGQQPMKKRF